MSNTIDTIEYTIAASYLCALAYGDTTGLDDTEERQLDEFVKKVNQDVKDNGFTSWHWSFGDDESYFGGCEICGLKADVTDVEVVMK